MAGASAGAPKTEMRRGRVAARAAAEGLDMMAANSPPSRARCRPAAGMRWSRRRHNSACQASSAAAASSASSAALPSSHASTQSGRYTT